MTVTAAPTPLFPTALLTETARWIRECAQSWHGEVPQQIHSTEIDEGGAREFSYDFLAYVDRVCYRDCRKPACEIEDRHRCHDLSCTHGQWRDPDPRVRTRSAFKKLRHAAPREFDALYLICARGLTFAETAEQLTERAIMLGKPERYDERSVLILAVSGIDKIQRYW